jgi:hypothetical protein
MAATRALPTDATAKAREAGDAVTSAARNVPTAALAAGAAVAGLAGGLALGSRRRRRFPVRRRTLVRGARSAVVAAGKAAGTAEDIRAIRMQLDRLNRRSPIEIVLDGLTHRRGAHKLET